MPPPFARPEPRFRCASKHRFGDAAIGAAAAEIAAHAFAHPLGIVTGLAFPDQTHRAYDLAGCAEAALESVMGDEGYLHRVKGFALRQPFDGQHLGAIVADRQCQAGVDAASV